MTDEANRRDVMSVAEPLLTDAEHTAMQLTVNLVNFMSSEVIADGLSRNGDVQEFVAHIHGIQRMILAQAAGRSYPDRYRLLGCTLGEDL